MRMVIGVCVAVGLLGLGAAGETVVLDGVVYDITQANHRSAIDARTGRIVAEKDLPLGKGKPYPSIAQAGGLLFVSSDNGTTLVMRPGRDFQVVTTNSLGETFRSSPVFEQGRMYVRGYKHLFCIGE